MKTAFRGNNSRAVFSTATLETFSVSGANVLLAKEQVCTKRLEFFDISSYFDLATVFLIFLAQIIAVFYPLCLQIFH